jgi:chemotaxis protein CheD
MMLTHTTHRAVSEPSPVQDIDQLPRVFLHTGDCYLGVQPTLVTTVLGSCVAVTMCDPRKGLGAICHAFLPNSVTFDSHGREPQLCRFVDTALDSMYASLLKLAVRPEDLVVKVFGGASGLMGGVQRTSLYDIGSRNIMAVRLWLMNHGLPIFKSQVGGNNGRKLHFLTHTGDVWLKQLNSSGREG